jgi:hypothetical protein
MKRVMWSLLALALLPACNPNKAPSAGAAAPVASPQLIASSATSPGEGGCNARTDRPWIEQQQPLRRYTAEASAEGTSCDIALATLKLRAREGSEIYTWSGDARTITGLKDATDARTMTEALATWIKQAPATAHVSSELPVWEETADQAQAREYPFHPDKAYTKAKWDELRAKKLDVFCFLSDSEAALCLLLQDGKISPLGLQQYPPT